MSNLNTDFDGDGCQDKTEDIDDDADGVTNPPDQYIFGRDIPNTEPWGACVMDLESVQELLAARHPDTYVPPLLSINPYPVPTEPHTTVCVAQ